MPSSPLWERKHGLYNSPHFCNYDHYPSWMIHYPYGYPGIPWGGGRYPGIPWEGGGYPGGTCPGYGTYP